MLLLVEFKTRIGPTESVQFFFRSATPMAQSSGAAVGRRSPLPFLVVAFHIFFFYRADRWLASWCPFCYFKPFSVSNYSGTRFTDKKYESFVHYCYYYRRPNDPPPVSTGKYAGDQYNGPCIAIYLLRYHIAGAVTFFLCHQLASGDPPAFVKCDRWGPWDPVKAYCFPVERKPGRGLVKSLGFFLAVGGALCWQADGVRSPVPWSVPAGETRCTAPLGRHARPPYS
jgi:hypothetical protein